MAGEDDRLRLLRWYVEMGVDEAIGEASNDRFAPPAPPAPITLVEPPAPLPEPLPSPPPRVVAAPTIQPRAGAQSARDAAERAQTLDELKAAVIAFEGCGLKRTATNTVFADGVQGAPLMVIGEAPGADEDRQGLPFVGRSGQLLDRMLAAIGRDRKRDAYITNVLFWRPPGNRTPTYEEVALCLPFVWRHIDLGRPKLVMLCGGTAVKAVLNLEGITRLRGRWHSLQIPGTDKVVPVMPTYHPSYLLRTPMRKGEAWRDLLSVQSKLDSTE